MIARDSNEGYISVCLKQYIQIKNEMAIGSQFLNQNLNVKTTSPSSQIIHLKIIYAVRDKKIILHQVGTHTVFSNRDTYIQNGADTLSTSLSKDDPECQ